MIKRMHFVSGVSSRGVTAWAEARLAQAPVDVRPRRSAVCTILHGIEGSWHDGISIDWFLDFLALQRFESWLDDRDLPGVRILAEEAILRGAPWLEQRWRDGGDKLKHMALARRAQGLTAAEFSERWRSRPGAIGRNAAIAIPDAARGHAYVQNHPLASAEYDAINEVWFDDLASMRPRLDFFRIHDVRRADAELVSEAKFLVVLERPVPCAR